MIRYAVYYAPPPGSALHRFGSEWLGRDAHTGECSAQSRVDGFDPARLAAITAAPRMYGFHATLKPPFALAPGRSAAEIDASCATFAATLAPFELAPLQLASIGGFLALVPSAPSTALDCLAERAVREFDAFRAHPSAADRARRARAALDARERELLAAWGYPYVLDRWQFHLTLTERLEPAERERVRSALAPAAEAVCRAPLRVDAVTLCVQPGTGAAFRYRSRFTFGRAA